MRALPDRQDSILQAIDVLSELLHGKREIVEVAFCALLTQGHVLLEDVPGVGKTTFIRSMARILGLEMGRIQCTSDLMPSDVLGADIYHPNEMGFVFHKGPLFAPLVLVDELNRASSRTQSALLEAMAEGQVTVGGKEYKLPDPFMVFASQNHTQSLGTYDLPESQLDRFSARMTIGYPSKEREVSLLLRLQSDPVPNLPTSLVSLDQLMAAKRWVENVRVSPVLAEYVQELTERTRCHPKIKLGLSPRGAMVWMRMARAYAWLRSREFVTPDDVRKMAPYVICHRLLIEKAYSSEAIVEEVLKSLPVP